MLARSVVTRLFIFPTKLELPASCPSTFFESLLAVEEVDLILAALSASVSLSVDSSVICGGKVESSLPSGSKCSPDVESGVVVPGLGV